MPHFGTMPFLLLLPLLLLAARPATAADLALDGGADGWDTARWRTQLDGVMGGRSSGNLRFEISNSVLSFDGNVNIDGGGFASVRRTGFGVVDLSPYAGVVVELVTTEAFNGASGSSTRPPLGLHLEMGDTASRYGFASAFAVPLAGAIGEEISVYLPLSSFDRGSWVGRQCTNCRLDASSVNEMEISVLFQEGPFDVRVKSITAVDGPRSFPSPSISIASAEELEAIIDAAIQSGTKLYNYNYRELCIAIYQSTLNSILAAEYDDTAESSKIKAAACQGLHRAETQSNGKADVAFTLRYTLDAILEELGVLDPAAGTGWRPDAATFAELGYRCEGVTSSGASFVELTNEPTGRPTADLTGRPLTEGPTASPSLATTTLTSLSTASPSLATTTLTTLSTASPTADVVLMLDLTTPATESSTPAAMQTTDAETTQPPPPATVLDAPEPTQSSDDGKMTMPASSASAISLCAGIAVAALFSCLLST